MAEQTQYLRIELQGRNYLLPSVTGYAIEPREALALHPSPGSPVVAWKNARNGRFAAYALDAELQPARNDNWQRVVFLEGGSKGVGIACDEVQLLPRSQTQVSPFTPPGGSTLQSGQLFVGAWLVGESVVLVLDPRRLIQYLQSLGE